MELMKLSRKATLKVYEEVHAEGLLHGDIHPRHVFVKRSASNAVVKLIDWEGSQVVEKMDVRLLEERTDVQFIVERGSEVSE